ncbi:hypothetical protein L209DRAFT_748047 [Thermothelomyces heterothallicus CBS 203.75]
MWVQPDRTDRTREIGAGSASLMAAEHIRMVFVVPPKRRRDLEANARRNALQIWVLVTGTLAAWGTV